MELMEGFLQTELGLICSDWTIVEFQEVMEGFSSGQTPYRGNPEFFRGEIPWITSGELNFNIIVDTKEKITPEGMKYANLKKVPKGTFLIAITGLEAAGTRGSCAITGIDATTNQSCMALYPKKDKLLTQYLFHYYVRYGNELAFKFCQGTKQQSYTAGLAKRLPIILPPSLREQTAIATALSDMDALIALTEKLIEKKKAIKQGMMQQLLSPYDAEGKLKEGWEIRILGDVFTFGSTANYSRAELSESDIIGYIHYGDIHTKFHSFLDVQYSQLPSISQIQSKNFTKIQEGDIVMADASEDYNGVGKSIEVMNILDKRIIAGLHTILLRDSTSTFHTGFRGLLFDSKFVREQFCQLATGLKVYSLSKSILKQVKLFVPPKEVQENISALIFDLNAEIQLSNQKLRKLNLLKQAMMQTLLTGKIRIYKPEHEPATEV